MKRRITFLDNLPAFNFNSGKGYIKLVGKKKWKYTDTSKLGSTLMSSMLKEVEHFCDSRQVTDWTNDPHQQVKKKQTLTYVVNTLLMFEVDNYFYLVDI